MANGSHDGKNYGDCDGDSYIEVYGPVGPQLLVCGQLFSLRILEVVWLQIHHLLIPVVTVILVSLHQRCCLLQIFLQNMAKSLRFVFRENKLNY